MTAPTSERFLPVEHEVHVPSPYDGEPKTRRKLMFWDRARLLVALSAFVALSIAIKHGDIPIMSWGEAVRDQVRAKNWVFWLIGLEFVHQLHLYISERSVGYHQFWETKIWGVWEALMSKLNPWLRYRLARMVRVLCWVTVALFAFASLWHVSFMEALVQAPGRLWTNPFGGSGLPWFFRFFFSFFYIIFQFVGMFWFLSRGGIDTLMPQEVKTRFRDVWGQDKTVEKVKENILFLDRPQDIESKGGHVPSGILLWGPPGTGKTLMAEAVAGETGKPYVFVDPGAFIQMFMGIGVLKVKGLFRKLRKLSLKYGGVIVFFDEADTLGNRGAAVGGGGFGSNAELHRMFASDAHCNGLHYLAPGTASMLTNERMAAIALAASATERRKGWREQLPIMMGGMGGGGGMGTLQALLTELSGLTKPRGIVSRRLRSVLSMKPKQPPKYRILVMMATNLPEALDEALLRPGRIDRTYKVGYPTLEGRVRTFEGYFAKVRHTITPEQVERLAMMSPKATGATIKDIVNESLIVAIRNGRDTVSWPDVLEAKTFKVHGMADGVAHSALEQHETAIHEASHAVACYLLRRREVIDIATIEQRGDIGGFVSPVPIEERKFDWRAEWEEDVVCSLVSLAGERAFFEGDNSNGVGGDLQSSTSVVRRMLAAAGMGDTLTSHFGGEGVGDAHRNEFDQRVELKLQELYQRAVTLVEENRWFLIAISHALQAYRTITGEDIDAIHRGVQGPTLDGAAYHDPGFRTAMLPYLAAARDAHRTQGKLSYPLPRVEIPVGALA